MLSSTITVTVYPQHLLVIWLVFKIVVAIGLQRFYIRTTPEISRTPGKVFLRHLLTQPEGIVIKALGILLFVPYIMVVYQQFRGFRWRAALPQVVQDYLDSQDDAIEAAKRRK